MLYTIPDYYKEFSCIAGDCEDTCCAGWQIVIDEKSKKRYAKAATGLDKIEKNFLHLENNVDSETDNSEAGRSNKKNLARELRRCVNWREGVFRQDTEKRCAFLNQDNLCRLYQMAGPDSLCRTCKMYPRHVEEFEGVREITLSLSCPEAARIILGKKEPVHFLSYEKPGEEDYGDFDLFFYSQLVDARESILNMFQDRSLSIHHRMALALAISHDMQAHVDRRELFSCEDIPKKYESEAARNYTKERLEAFEKDEERRFEFAQKAFQYLYRLELLKENWLYVLMDADKLLYGGLASVYENSAKSDAVHGNKDGQTESKSDITNIENPCINCDGADTDSDYANIDGDKKCADAYYNEEDIDQLRYFVNLQEFELWKHEHMPDWDIMLEQMLVYFVFTYFCGAVYDGCIQAKMQVCVYSVYIIEEILRARWLENEKTLSMEEVVELTYRYSREVEHSDQNPERLEHFMEKNPWIRVRK